jgi:hypothetical protein
MPRVANPLIKVRKRLEPCCFSLANFKELPKDKDKVVAPNKHLNFYRKNIPIQREIVPKVDEALDLACERLGLDRETVHGFVENDPTMNAACYPGYRGNAVVTVNSGLIEKLTMPELLYIMGHELGHYIMPLPTVRVPNGRGGVRPASMEDAMTQRHLEISMDRFGLVACRDVDVACMAALKIQSGLGSEFIRADLQVFARETFKGYVKDYAEYEDEAFASHPYVYARIRALHLFAQSQEYLELTGQPGKGRALDAVNAEVLKDMEDTLDYFAKKLMEDALREFSQAIAAVNLDMDGTVELSRYVTSLIPAPELDAVKLIAKSLSKVPLEERGKVATGHFDVLANKAVNFCPRRTIAHLAQLLEQLKGTSVHPFAEDASAQFQVKFKEHFRIA